MWNALITSSCFNQLALIESDCLWLIELLCLIACDFYGFNCLCFLLLFFAKLHSSKYEGEWSIMAFLFEIIYMFLWDKEIFLFMKTILSMNHFELNVCSDYLNYFTRKCYEIMLSLKVFHINGYEFSYSTSEASSGEMLVGLFRFLPTWEQDKSSKHIFFIELPLHLFSDLSLSLWCIFAVTFPSQASLRFCVYLNPWRIPSTLVCWTCCKPSENIPNRGEASNHRWYSM